MQKSISSFAESENLHSNIKSAITIGKFDGFHLGHQLLIDRLHDFKENGMRAVAIRIESSNPGILTAEEVDFLSKKIGLDEVVSLKFTDDLRKMSPETFVQEVLLKRYHAGAIVVGTDFRFGYERKGSILELADFSEQYGFAFDAVSKLKIEDEVVSSTAIRDALSIGDVEKVNKFLGYRYFVSGIVQHGKHLGTTIGFPTLNLLPDKMKILPKFGVYETVVTIGDEQYVGVTNVGNRPTIDDGEAVSVESFLIDFNQDVYGHEVQVEFVRFIRAEKKFNSLDELIQQLKNDITCVKTHC